MPIDARIPLGVQGIDPNGFINALAAGQRQRELNNASDRLARKDELAALKNNALATYGASPRGLADRARVWAVDPATGMALDKAAAEIDQNTQDAAYNKIRTDKVTTEVAIKKHGMISQLLGAVKEDPSLYPQVRARVIEIEPSAAKSWPEGYDPAFVDITYRGGMKLGEQLQAQKANEPPPPRWDSYTGRYVQAPPGSPTAPPAGAGPEASVPPGTVVPGGELPPPEDIEAAVLHRAGQGPAPTGNVDYEGLSDQGLDELQRTSSASRKPPPPAVPPAPPVDGQPVTAQPPPMVYRNPAERDAHRDAVKDARYRDEQASKAPKTITKGGVTYQYADGRWIPAQGVVTTPPDPPRAVSQADAKWLKDQDESGAAAEKLSSTIEQARSVIAAPGGVLGNSPMDQAAYKLHEWGLNNSDTSVNTERLRELGAQMTLSFGSLGAQVSNADREVYARAQGNFENAKSAEAMKLSLDQMAAVSERVIEKINRNRTTYQQTGRKPDFVAAPPAGATSHADTSPVLPKPEKAAPLEDLDAMPMPGKYNGKFLTTPEGLRYRSDGSRWVRQ